MTSFEQILEKFGPDAQIIRKRMKGFTEQEVQAVMQAQGVKRLPKLYLELLLMAGHFGGHRLHPGKSAGDEDLYFDLISAKEDILETMSYDEKTRPSLPDNAFVFVNDLSSLFLFFLTNNDEDDPPVYRYYEETEAPTIKWPSLSTFFNEVIEWRAEQKEKRKQELC